MLVYFALGDASFSRFYPTPNLKFALPPTPIPDASQWNIGGNPRRQPVEYRWRWVLALGLCVGHVHFIFFVLISCPTQSRFSVEYGLKYIRNLTCYLDPPTPFLHVIRNGNVKEA